METNDLIQAFSILVFVAVGLTAVFKVYQEGGNVGKAFSEFVNYITGNKEVEVSLEKWIADMDEQELIHTFAVAGVRIANMQPNEAIQKLAKFIEDTTDGIVEEETTE